MCVCGGGPLTEEMALLLRSNRVAGMVPGESEGMAAGTSSAGMASSLHGVP